MSLIQDLGAQLRATSEQLPTGLVAVAVQRLQAAADLLMWVRQQSVDQVGVPQVANATEHAEHAAYALRAAQDALARYLADIGLAQDAVVPADQDWRTVVEHQPRPPAPAAGNDAATVAPLRRWWVERVGTLTAAGPQTDEAGTAGARSAGPEGTGDLLEQVAADVRAGDRTRLHRSLAATEPPVGLGLSAVAPPILHRLAGELLGHRPGPDDLSRLRERTAGRVADLLPGLPRPVLDTLLARLCRAPDAGGDPAHPADSAVAAGVLTGVMLSDLGREPASLDPRAPEPVRDRDG